MIGFAGVVRFFAALLTVYKKSDGKWLIIRDTWNADAPPAPATPAKK